MVHISAKNSLSPVYTDKWQKMVKNKSRTLEVSRRIKIKSIHIIQEGKNLVLQVGRFCEIVYK